MCRNLYSFYLVYMKAQRGKLISENKMNLLDMDIYRFQFLKENNST